MNPIQPPYLKKGDKIAIVACAGKLAEEKVKPAIEILKSWGLEVVIGKHVFSQYNQFSGTDELRAEDLQWALNDNSIKAVISARGGYGAIRIVDKIDFTKFKKSPKWMIGYSDITVLHSHIHNIGIESIHAVMPVNFLVNAEATESLREALFGEKLSYEIKANTLNRKGKAVAQLVGGNLSLLYALTGSVSDINTDGKILFIEDLNEYLYHLDRMMMNLKRSGKLSKLAGLIVGGITDMKDNEVPFGKSAQEIILDAVKEYNYPVCFDFPAGHIDKNMALYFAKSAEFSVDNTVKLSFSFAQLIS